MSNTTTLGTARQRLVDALDASRDDAREAAATRLFAGELLLRKAGREDLGYRLPDAEAADVTTAATRRELRDVISLIDADLDPEVSVSSFQPASDGGVRDE